MPRPAKPKLPVSKTLISEVLQRVSNAKTKDKKVEILKEYKSPALTKLLLCNYAESIRFCFPSGETPYKPYDRPKGVDHQYIYTEHRLIEKFIAKKVNGVVWYGCSNSTKPRIQQLRKEAMWVQLLEGLHPEEAEVLDLVKDKKLNSKYKITKQNVIDAFPELRLQDEQ